MAPSRALALAEPVISALAHAHRAGLIHRDVKPENVLIADDGRVKVADFGLAKAVSADTQHTATGGVLIGTVSYLAPELVVDGRSDARADVYAVGVLLYELLTGTKPHEGESPIQVAYKHVHEDVPPPSTIVPGLPAYVDALVSRATARDLDQRPADAGVLLHQVHRVAQALRDGVREDEELTRDLALRPVGLARTRGHRAGPLRRRRVRPDVDRGGSTGRGDRRGAPHHGARPPPRAAARPGRPDHHDPPAAPVQEGSPAPAARPVARRGRRRGRLVVRLGALHLGPGRPRHDAEPRREEARGGRPDRRGRRPGVLRDRARGSRARRRPGGRRPGPRRRDGHARGLAGQGAVRRPAHAGRVGGRRRRTPCSTPTSPSARPSAAGPRRCPRARCCAATRRPARPCGPARSSTCTSARAASPSRSPTGPARTSWRPAPPWSGRASRSAPPTSTPTPSPQGDVISQSPDEGTLFRGDQVGFVVSLGPELVEVPGGLVASGWESAQESLEAAGFVVEIEHVDDYLGLGFVYSVDPGSGSSSPGDPRSPSGSSRWPSGPRPCWRP